MNWLFTDTPKGANASATVYSIVETAKTNGLNIFNYLEFLLLYMPDMDYHNGPTALENLMPRSSNVESYKGFTLFNALIIYFLNLLHT